MKNITLKAQKLNIKDFQLSMLMKMHNTNVMCCKRVDVEALGINSYCAFADTTTKTIFLIEEDCETLSKQSLIVILMHELAHIIIPSISEEQADEYAARFTNQKAVTIARKETENVRDRIRAARIGMYTPMAVEF